MDIKEIRLVEWFDDHFYKIEYDAEVKPEILQTVTDYFPSVTTKLGVISKPFLAKWRGDIGNREADLRVFEACERGVRIHHGWYTMTTFGAVIYQPNQRPNYTSEEISELTEQHLGNVSVIRYQDEMYDLYKLSRWVDAVKPQMLHSEKIVYSIKNRDAGTVDNVMFIKAGKYSINGSKPLELPEGNYVVDLKTGNSVDDDAFMQISAYSECLKEMGVCETVGGLILHTGAKTKTAIEGLATLYRSKEQMEQDYQDYRLAAALWERKNADFKPRVFEFPSLLTLKGENNGS